MKTNEFFATYANTPIADRDTPFDFSISGITTLSEACVRVRELQDKIRPEQIEIDQIVREAEWFWHLIRERRNDKVSGDSRTVKHENNNDNNNNH